MVNPHDKLASDTVAKSLKFVDGHCCWHALEKWQNFITWQLQFGVAASTEYLGKTKSSPRNVVKLTKKYCRPTKIKGYIS